MFILVLLNLYVILNDLPIPEYGKLLLHSGLLLGCHIELMQCRMYVLHYLEEVIGETNMNVGTVNELIQSLLIHFLIIMRQEYYFIM